MVHGHKCWEMTRGLAFPRGEFPTELFLQMDEFLRHAHTKRNTSVSQMAMSWEINDGADPHKAGLAARVLPPLQSRRWFLKRAV